MSREIQRQSLQLLYKILHAVLFSSLRVLYYTNGSWIMPGCQPFHYHATDNESPCDSCFCSDLYSTAGSLETQQPAAEIAMSRRKSIVQLSSKPDLYISDHNWLGSTGEFAICQVCASSVTVHSIHPAAASRTGYGSWHHTWRLRSTFPSLASLLKERPLKT